MAVDGTPVAERSGLALVAVEELEVLDVFDFDFDFDLELDFGLTVGVEPCDFGWLVAEGEFGWLAVAELELERLVEEEPEELELLDELEPLDDVVVVVVPVGDVQDWVTLSTGREVSECGSTVVPAGRETLKASWRPPATVTVTVQGSAAALATGIATRPATTAQHIAAATLSFMRMVTG